MRDGTSPEPRDLGSRNTAYRYGGFYPRSRTGSDDDDQNAAAADAARGATGAVTPLILIYVFLSTLQHGERPSRRPQGRS
jgi:hypothetical protein